MPLGIVSNEEMEMEISKMNTNNAVVRTTIIGLEQGKRGNAIPDGLKKIIAEEVIEGGKVTDLAKTFDVPQSSVSAYSNGSATPGHKNDNEKLVKHLELVKERIKKKASNKLINALDAITNEKLNESKARDLAGIAKDMAATIEKLEGRDKQVDNSNKVQINLFVPKQNDLTSYEVIEQ